MSEPVPSVTAPSPTRRGLHRLLAGGLATVAVSPLLSGGESAASTPGLAPGEDRAGAQAGKKGKRKWHRCKVHRRHTCYRARTCRHRKHKPHPPTHDDPPTGCLLYTSPSPRDS